MSENEVENLKLRAGAAKAPVGIVPMHTAYGESRILEDSACKYAPFNYMAQPLADALESYDSALLRHRIACTKLGGQVTPETYAELDEDSGLPHIFHMITGLKILATLMIRDGVLKLDPGPGKRKQLADTEKHLVELAQEIGRAGVTVDEGDICPFGEAGCAACKL